MATIIKPKRSETLSSAPTTSNLAVGEIAINTADQKIYTRDSGNNIVTLAQPGLLNVVEDTTPQLGGSLDTNGNHINFGDNDKAIFGAGSDLQIYHDGTNSYIDDAGTGNILYRSGTQTFQNANGSKTMAVFKAASSVDLSYNNSIKFQTTTDGTLTCGSSTITDGTISWPFASNSDNLHIGTDASCSLTTGANNIAVGCLSLKLNEDGTDNVAIGQNSLCCATTPSCNIVIGKNSLCASDECTFVGCWDGSSYPTVTRSTEKNIVIGNNLLTNETMSHNNTVIGNNIANCSASYICTWGCTCTCNGLSAIPYTERSGNDNTLIGNCIAPYNCRVEKTVVLGSCINYSNTASGAVKCSQIFGYNIMNCATSPDICCSNRGGLIECSFIAGDNMYEDKPVGVLRCSIVVGTKIGTGDSCYCCGPSTYGATDVHCTVSSIIVGACAAGRSDFIDSSVVVGARAAYTLAANSYSTYIGYGAGGNEIGTSVVNARNTISERNTAIGVSAMGEMGRECDTSGSDLSICGNTAVGGNSLWQVADHWNTAVGNFAGTHLYKGQYNVFLGSNSGYNVGCNVSTTSSNNTFLGTQAGCDVITGSNNTIIGFNSQASSTTVSNEITLGDSNITSLRIPGLQSSATDGQVLTYCSTNGNIVFKDSSGCNWDPLVSGALCNIYISNTACSLSSGGLCNTVVGHLAGCSLTTSDRNTLIGLCAGMKLEGSSTCNNVAVGNGALSQVEQSNHNVAVGFSVMGGCTPGTNSKGCYNIALGQRAGYCLASSGRCNILIGRDTAFNLTTGGNNVAIGAYAMERATTNGNQVVIGQNAAQYLIGGNNIAIGNAAVRGNSSGDCTAGSNIGIGNGAASGLTTGACNISMGHLSGDVSTGKCNMFLGHVSGYHGTQHVTGCCNVVIGNCAGQSLANDNSGSNNIIIGYNADFSGSLDGTCSNTIIIGNSSHNQLIIPGLSAGQGQTLCFNGSGFVASDSAGITSWAICTSNFTSVAGEGYFIDTSSSTITATLPASASIGDEIYFKDYGDTFDTNTLTVSRNSHNIEGSATDLPVSTEGAGFTLVYVDSTRGWVHKNKIDEQSFFNDSTITIAPGSEGNFDLSYDPDQTTQETPFESGGVDAFGVAVSSYQYSLMDPVNELVNVDLGELS